MEFPQLQFLTRLACLSLCNDRCPGLLGRVRGQGCCHVRCCARRGSRRAENCAPQLLFFNKVFMPVLVHGQGVVGSDSPENVWRCRRCSSACFQLGHQGPLLELLCQTGGVALTPGVYSQVLGHQLVSETDVHVGVAACRQTHVCSIASKTTTTTRGSVLPGEEPPPHSGE